MRCSLTLLLLILAFPAVTVVDSAAERARLDAGIVDPPLRSGSGTSTLQVISGRSGLTIVGDGLVGVRESHVPASDETLTELVDTSGGTVATLRRQMSMAGDGHSVVVRVVTPNGAVVQALGESLIEREAIARTRARAETAGSTLALTAEDGSEVTIMAAANIALELAGEEILNKGADRDPSQGPIGVTTGQPPAFALLPNQPNPFRHSTLLRFALPEAGHVTLGVYDIVGRRVVTLLDEDRSAGTHAIEYRTGLRAKGVYYVRLAFTNTAGTSTHRASQPIVLLR